MFIKYAHVLHLVLSIMDLYFRSSIVDHVIWESIFFIIFTVETLKIILSFTFPPKCKESVLIH